MHTLYLLKNAIPEKEPKTINRPKTRYFGWSAAVIDRSQSESMERVRMPHVRQVAVPAPLPVPLEMSKEERHRLRVARHQAFQRHQQNAAWTRELLVGHSPPLAAGASSATPRAFAARLAGLSSDAVRKVLEDKQRALATVQSELERAEQQLERAEG
jgi:hypothetical protein